MSWSKRNSCPIKANEAMELQILSPDGCLFQGEVDQVSFPGLEGRFEVWPAHAPLIVALDEGTIRYRAAGNEQQQQIASGLVEVFQDKLTVCIETATDRYVE